MKKQWADGPLPLIETPRHKYAQNNTQSPTSEVATDMAQAHNIIIRGLNTMIIQAPFISTPRDIKDFTNYCLSLCIVLHEHHSTEEVLTFPLIEDATGVPGIMDRNVIQHESFLHQLHNWNVYLTQIKIGTRKYDAKKFMGLLDSFSALLVEHLKAEVDMFVELEKYGIDWAPINKRTIQHAIEYAEKYQEIPFVLHNMDVTYEDNLHVGVWPPLPWIAQLIFRWFYVPRYKSAWRFGSCDVYGRPKELEFAPLV